MGWFFGAWKSVEIDLILESGEWGGFLEPGRVLRSDIGRKEAHRSPGGVLTNIRGAHRAAGITESWGCGWLRVQGSGG